MTQIGWHAVKPINQSINQRFNRLYADLGLIRSRFYTVPNMKTFDTISVDIILPICEGGKSVFKDLGC